jgi:hypothetical protein
MSQFTSQYYFFISVKSLSLIHQKRKGVIVICSSKYYIVELVLFVLESLKMRIFKTFLYFFYNKAYLSLLLC